MSSRPVSPSQTLEDASGYVGQADRVLTPSTVAELRDIVDEARRTHTPLTVAGARTGLTGASVPDAGWAVSLNRFRRLDISQGRVRCGVGITLRELEDAAFPTGQFFGPNPTEYSASVGGMISTNAGGARSFCYGSVRHQILGLETTFMDSHTRWLSRGEPVGFPVPAISRPATTKNSAGYHLEPGVDWVNLLSGSEGTLGIVTEAELKLVPVAPAILSGVVFFRSDSSALDAVDSWRPLARLRQLEYLDDASLNLMRRTHPDIPAAARAALMIEQDLNAEDDPEVDRWLERLTEFQAMDEESWFGFTAADRERFRTFRHALAAQVVEHARQHKFPKLGTDFAVPLDRSRDLLRYYRDRCEALVPGKYVIYGHIGDANVHMNIMPDTAEQAAVGRDLMLEFARYAISLGGTVAAEHGIGKIKRDLFRMMYSSADIEAMKSIKRRLDPDWLLGRDVIFEAPLT